MGTLLKYIFYVIVILMIYLVIKDIYDGKITSDTTMHEVEESVAQQSKQIINQGVDAVQKAAQ